MSESKFIDYFDQIYIINLESRADRRTEVAAQLKKINLSLNHPKLTLFKAVKPTDKGEFPSIGARGCFMSHLGVLKDIQSKKFKRVLVLEDDLDLINHFNSKADLVLIKLFETDWDIFYGDYRIHNFDLTDANHMKIVNPEINIVTTDFMGFNGQVVDAIIHYFEAMLLRKDGDALGGPMHVDGAYSWFRKDNVKFTTVIATPPLGFQRSSASDIADSTWINKLPFIHIVRSFLNKISK